MKLSLWIASLIKWFYDTFMNPLPDEDEEDTIGE